MGFPKMFRGRGLPNAGFTEAGGIVRPPAPRESQPALAVEQFAIFPKAGFTCGRIFDDNPPLAEMGLKTSESNPVAETVAANKRFFLLFCMAGLVLVGGGLFTLRLDKTITASGEVRAENEYFVFAPATAVLARHHVRIGQEVEAGAPLFSMAGEDLDLRILEKRRELAEAGGELAEVQLALKRAEIKPGELEMLTARARLEVLDQIQEIHREIVAAWDRLEGERAIRGLEYNLQRIASLRTRLESLDSKFLAEWEEAGLLPLEQEMLAQRGERLREVQEVLREEIAVFQRQRESLEVSAPAAGVVVDVYQRYPGLALQEGEAVMKIANLDRGYRVKAYVGQRNVDLLRLGTAVRMESQVFDSLFEGYVLGAVERIVSEANRASTPDPEDPRYEITVAVEETPYPLVLGSRVKVEFLLGRQSLAGLLLNRPTEERPAASAGD